jgi:hypothetical protein
MDQQSSASDSLAPLGMELFAINLQFSQSDGGHASVSGVSCSAQGDEKRVQLLERLAKPTLHSGGDGTVESFLRGI